MNRTTCGPIGWRPTGACRGLRLVRTAVAVGLLALPWTLPSIAGAQLSSNAAGVSMARTAPRVFLQCDAQVPCNENVLGSQVPWVEWLSGAEGAQVLVTVSGNGAAEGGDGSRNFVLAFLGMGSMDHLRDELTYAADASADPATISQGIAQVLALGLLRYGVEAGLGTGFEVAASPRLIAAVSDAGSAGASAEDGAQVAYDPWNYWQFRVGLGGNMNIRERESSYRIDPSLSADRVTENWKLNFNLGFGLDRRTTKIPATETNPGREIEDNRDSWRVNGLVVKSIGTHTSTGVDFGAGNSVRDNQRARVTVAPGIEWNYYPYAESNRRQLIAHYAAGMEYSDYTERTIFGETSEMLPLHKIGVQYRASETWGNAGISLNASQYLHSTSLYSFGASGGLNLRIIRGLELSLNASGSKIADQIYLPMSELSEEDVLLGRQSLPTGYSFQFSAGLNYRFGSNFSNIVNSRMPSLGFGGGGGGPGFGGPGFGGPGGGGRGGGGGGF